MIDEYFGASIAVNILSYRRSGEVNGLNHRVGQGGPLVQSGHGSFRLGGPGRFWSGLLLACLLAVPAPIWSADLDFAHGLYAEQRYELAAKEYEDYLQNTPVNDRTDEAQFFLAESYVQLGRPGDALELYRKLALPSGVRGAHYHLALLRSGVLLLEQRNGAAAEEYLARFLKQFPDDSQSRTAAYFLAEALMVQNKNREARGVLDQAIKRDGSGPVGVNLRFARAKLAEREGQLTQARELYRSVAEESAHPLADDAQLAMGILQFNHKQYEDAIVTFAKLASRFPDSELTPTALLNQGLCMVQLERYDEAAEIFEGLTDMPVGHPAYGKVAPDAWYRLGLCYYSQAKYPKAAATFAQALEAFPEVPQTPDFRYFEGLALLQAGQIGGAKAKLAGYVQAFGNHEMADRGWYYLARAALKDNDSATVKSAFERLIQSYPASPLGDKAAVVVVESLVQEPDSPSNRQLLEQLQTRVRDPATRNELLYHTAKAYYHWKDYAQARALLEEVIRSEPVAATPLGENARYLLGLSLANLGADADAIRSLAAYIDGSLKKSSIGENSDEASARMLDTAIRTLGQSIARTPQSRETTEYLRSLSQRLTNQPRGAAWILELGDAQYAVSRPELAAELFQKTIESSESPELVVRARVGRGWSLYNLGQKDPAREEFRKALQVDSADARSRGEAVYMLGVIADEQKDSKSALERFQQLLDLYPESTYCTDAGTRAARLLKADGRLADAEALLSRIAQRMPDKDEARAALVYQQAWLALEQQKDDEAIERFEQCVQLSPQTDRAAESLLKLAVLYAQRKQVEKANRLLDQLEEWKPAPRYEAALLFRRGMLAFQASNYDRAKEMWARLRNEFPADRLAATSRYWLAEIDLEQGRPAEAREQFNALLGDPSADDHHANAKLRIAQCYLLERDWKQAYDRAAPFVEDVTSPLRRAEANYVQGRALQKMARFDEARAAYARAIGKEGTELEAKAQFMIGECYFHQRRYEDAIREFLKVEILHQFPEWRSLALLEIGKCHENLRQRNEARATYQKLIDKYPGSKEADEARPRLVALEKQPE